MPGRQSTGPLDTAKPKNKKRTARRSLNALAIAEQQHPTKSQFRQNRLGIAERDHGGIKRKLDHESSEREDGTRSSKRRRAGDRNRYGNDIEDGSDSEGNEWVLGQVNSEDDSDLDSDAAMGESDEEKFEGFTFRGSSSTGTKAKVRRKVEEAGSKDEKLQEIDFRIGSTTLGGSEEESGGFAEDAIDLADALDDNGGESTGSESESGSSQGGFGSSDNSDQEDVADPKKLAFLGDMISTLNSSDQTLTEGQKPINGGLESTAPSEFGIRSSQKLSVADLRAAITDPNLRKSLKLFAPDISKSSTKRSSIPKKLEVPLAKRQQDRLDRAAAYEKSKETLNRWIDTVKHNRRAEYLSFPLRDRNSAIAQGAHRMTPTTQSKPATELEGVIREILLVSGLGPTKEEDEEYQLDGFADMPPNNMPLEEVQARRAELRRARDLLFREEKRAKRIKKIKSKSYRKVHRKERERNAQREKDTMAAAGIDDAEEEQAKNDRRRAEERMGQRHRESRWAKSVKDSGRAAWDENARTGVTEMARRGEELRRRIEGKAVETHDDGDDASSESEPSDNYESDCGDQEGSNDRLLDHLRRANGDEAVGGQGNRSTLSSMAFMQKASSLHRARNDAEAEEIRRELNDEEPLSEKAPSGAVGRRFYGPSTNDNSLPKVTAPAEQRSEFEERYASEDENEIGFSPPEEEDFEIIVNTADNGQVSKSKEKPSASRTHRQQSASAPGAEQFSYHADNPWLSMATKSSRKSHKENHSTDAIISTTLPPSPPEPGPVFKGSRAAGAAATSQILPTTKGVTLNDAVSNSSSVDGESAQNPIILRNRDLVAKAFAGDAVVADFEAEKAETTKNEGEKIIDSTLPGWGTWVGEGLTKRAQKLKTNRFLKTVPGLPQEKRKDAKLNKVIINEKRVKKNGKYLASQLPHPFETKAQYERSLRLPVGPEWSTKETFQGMTKPRVMVKQGIIEPMKRPMG